MVQTKDVEKELDTYVEEGALMYMFAENLFGASIYLQSIEPEQKRP